MNLTVEFIETAQGTCLSVEEVLSQIDADEDFIDWDEVDNQVARCDCCSWWVEAHDVDEFHTCSDCQDD